MITIPVVLKDKELRPTYAHENDAGADLRSPIEVVIPSGDRVFIPTGVHVQLPDNCVGFVTPRSGLAKKHGITIPNSPGIVDSGYRGEIGVTLHNLGDIDYKISKGERIAQFVIVPFVQGDFILVDTLETSDRGSGGFGSTGRH
jgi:dUTP pyrophosphatase